MHRSFVLILALCGCGSGIMNRPAQCIDGVKNGSETDVDCGGGTCAPCAGGKMCNLAGDCQSNSCSGHVCVTAPATCSDGMTDGNETDVDCGGGTCAACANGKVCLGPPDCASGSCVNHVCMSPPAQCLNGMTDGNETDVDCGGGTCATCANGKACLVASDCTSGACINHACAQPPAQCSDTMKDGNETDVDCGGDTCAPCSNGKACMIPADCVTGTCTNHMCKTPVAQCLDAMKDGNETDVDCGGGTCQACTNGKACVAPTDCQSATCINHQCSSPPAQCLDNAKDGSETDADCGGGTCPACANGKTCLAPTDCQSGSCTNGKCSSPPAQCLDNMKDGNETDVDCGGGTCLACVDGKSCGKGTDCQSGVCSSGVCTTPPAQCLDNVKDANETDIDCGGGTCPACVIGKSCNGNNDCASAYCNPSTRKCDTMMTGSCLVTCTAGSAGTCMASCNGHTYLLQCTCGTTPSCFCEQDSQTQKGASISQCETSLLFNAYSEQCGYPGSQG